MKKLNVKGFSMIELLVVLLIIGILAAVAAPLFLGNSTKAKVSEAVAGAGSIRSAERTWVSQNSPPGLAVTDGKTYFGTGVNNQSAVLGVQIHGNKYFSPEAYQVAVSAAATPPYTLSWSAGTLPTGISALANDFVITATGSNSVSLATNSTDGAANNGDVANYIVKMDNTGQTIYTTDGTTWNKF